MSNQNSLNMLHANPANWLQSRHLSSAGDPTVGHALDNYLFGSFVENIPDPLSANRALRSGYAQTAHPKGRAARQLIPAGSGMVPADSVAEQVGHIPMLYSRDINFSLPLPMGPLGTFAAMRFAVTGQLSGCCFLWDKVANTVAHIKPSGMPGHALRTALAATGFTLFGVSSPLGGAEYTAGERVTIIGVNNGGWNFYAQVCTAMTRHILRVVTL